MSRPRGSEKIGHLRLRGVRTEEHSQPVVIEELCFTNTRMGRNR